VKPRQQAYELFEQGRRLHDVADEIGRSTGRTATYLADYIKLNKVEQVEPWTDEGTLQRVEQAVRSGGSRRVRTLAQVLCGEVSREQVKICLALLDNRR
jgi:hypothetical protein